MKIISIAFFLLILTSMAALAEQEQIACDEMSSNIEIVNCLGNDYEEIDKKLNDVYQKLIAKAKSIDEEHSGSNKNLENEYSHENELRKAQRAWIGFRDAECEFVSGSGSEYIGYWNKMTSFWCLIRETKKRIDSLENYLRIWPEGY